MEHLKDLIALKQQVAETPVHEEELVEARSRGFDDLIEKWQDQNKAYSWEGSRGIDNLTKLVRVLGYRSLNDFLSDNSGAIEEMVGWISNQRMPEWKEALENEVGSDD